MLDNKERVIYGAVDSTNGAVTRTFVSEESNVCLGARAHEVSGRSPPTTRR